MQDTVCASLNMNMPFSCVRGIGETPYVMNHHKQQRNTDPLFSAESKQ